MKKSPIIHVKELALATHIFFMKITSRFSKQWHPLHIAAAQGHLQLYKHIFEKTDDKNPKSFEGLTPLQLAAQEGHLAVCKFIIERVDDKNPRDEKGTTPLHAAARCGHFEICKFIMKYLDEKNPKDNVAFTPHDGCYFGQKIIRNKICYFTPLHLAAHEGL